jgi:hypothetical protein
LVGLGAQEVRQLLLTLDQDGDQRISPHELNLAILDWLSEANNTPISTAFASLLVLYGLQDEGVNPKTISDARPHTTSDLLYAQTGYAR